MARQLHKNRYIKFPFWIHLYPWLILTTVPTITHTGHFENLALVPGSTSNMLHGSESTAKIVYRGTLYIECPFLNPSFDIGGNQTPVCAITAYSYMVLVNILNSFEANA